MTRPQMGDFQVAIRAMGKRIKTDEIENLLLIAGKLKLPKLDAIEIILEKIRGKYQPIV